MCSLYSVLQLPGVQSQLNQLSQVLCHHMGREMTRKHLLQAFQPFQSMGCDLMRLEGIALQIFVGSSWEHVRECLWEWVAGAGCLSLVSHTWIPRCLNASCFPSAQGRTPTETPEIEFPHYQQASNWAIGSSLGTAPSVTLPSPRLTCSPRQPGPDKVASQIPHLFLKTLAQGN